MSRTEEEVDRYIHLLRTKMREKSYNQREVQEALSWGKTYVSQILNKQKKLRVDQVVAILDVIGVDPREFFAELYDLEHGLRGIGGSQPPGADDELRREVGDLREMLRRMVKLLVRKKVVSAKEAGQVL